ncbi:MAG: hypothetical protein IID41_02935 [Planctomycetes bacterium]|nr:hypothetical protein [Planctomycetota bacterium]
MMYRRSYGYDRSADRFDNYREIDARFASTGSCGHPIAKGDRIGWHRALKKTQCATCWARWVAENAEADAMERGYL